MPPERTPSLVLGNPTPGFEEEEDNGVGQRDYVGIDNPRCPVMEYETI